MALTIVVRAELIGDISATANAMYSGKTYHGYAERRVVLENVSATRTHVVTLTYPNRQWGGSENRISRITRTVTVAPRTREVVSFLQPPLSANGDNQIRLDVDRSITGEIRAPNGGHCESSYSGPGTSQPATVFVSRSLDFDAVDRVFRADNGAFMASKATGAPDAKGYGNSPECWMPDTRTYGKTNWLELDYASPQTVTRVSFHTTQSPPNKGDVTLIGVSGTNIARVAMSAGKRTSASVGYDMEFTFPATSEAVRSVRLNFDNISPSSISIDAVEISGPAGSRWASAARASSDNNASAASYIGSRTTDSVECLRAESPVSEWSENWLAYTPFDVIVLHESDVGAMPAAVFTAISDYLESGGRIVILGKRDLPSAWRSAARNSIAGGVEHTIGFGACMLFSTTSPAALEQGAVQNLRQQARGESMYWQSLPQDSKTANSLLPVVENLKVPTRGIVVIMLAFIILIGPVNIILLNRRNRRTWMLWTIPAISFATTLIVFIYSLLREGITPDTRIAGITVLDQVTHRSATIGMTGFYCPLTPGNGLQFEYGTEAAPLVSRSHYYGSSRGTAREVDWSQSQHFQRGWISSRVPAHFHLRKAGVRRERVQIVNENGAIFAVNSLGAPVKSLWVADADMNLYKADNIPAGQKGSLTLAKSAGSASTGGAVGLLQKIGPAGGNIQNIEVEAPRLLTPNSYIAVMDGNPFIEIALSSSTPDRTKKSAVVFGILEPREAK